jgi:hypothetical protein
MRKLLKSKYGVASAVSLITFFVYLGALQNSFVDWDDGYYIFENPNIRFVNAHLFRWAFLESYASNWHPLTWLSHALDYALWGLNAAGHHLTNNILHALNTLLVVLLATRLLTSSHDLRLKTVDYSRRVSQDSSAPADPPAAGDLRFVLIAAGTTGLLFGIHPVHVESVAWVSERKDLLCALFFLLSVLTFVSYRSHKSSKTYLLSLACFVLALLSKPMAVTLPIVLLILDWHPFGRIESVRAFRGAIVEKLPFISLSLFSSVITVLAQKTGESVVPADVIPFSVRLLVAGKNLIAYLGKMLLPLNLVPFYPYPSAVSISSLQYFLPVILIFSITVICTVLARRRKLWLSVWSYYVATLLPVLGIIQVGSQSMADRYTYLPSLGPFLATGVGVAWISKKIASARERKKMVFAVAYGAAVLLVFISLSLLTVRQIGVWKNSLALWNYVVEKDPDVYVGYNERAVAYYRIRSFDKAIADIKKALELNPHLNRAYYNMACIFSLQGRTEEACIWLKKSVEKGYHNRTHMKKDPDLANIRGSSCYQEIVVNKWREEKE